MIWLSLLWETLEWIEESGDKTFADISLNESNWGNFVNSEFSYNNGSSLVVKQPGNCALVPTGSSEKNKANNIYDIAGNLSEVTLGMHMYESYSTSCTMRAILPSNYYTGGHNYPTGTTTMHSVGVDPKLSYYGGYNYKCSYRAMFYIK